MIEPDSVIRTEIKDHGEGIKSGTSCVYIPGNEDNNNGQDYEIKASFRWDGCVNLWFKDNDYKSEEVYIHECDLARLIRRLQMIRAEQEKIIDKEYL